MYLSNRPGVRKTLESLKFEAVMLPVRIAHIIVHIIRHKCHIQHVTKL